MEREVLVPDIGDFEDVDVIEVLVEPGQTVAEGDSLITLESAKATMEIPSPAAGKVKALHVKVGDKVSEGDKLCTLEVAAGKEAAPEKKAKSEKPAKPEKEAPKKAEDEAKAKPEEKEAQAPAREETAPKKKAKAQESESEAREQEAAEAPAKEAEPPAAEARPEAEERSFIYPGLSPRPPGQKAHAGPSVRRMARELGVDLAQVKGRGPKGRILKEDVQDFVKAAMSAASRPAAAPTGGVTLPEAPEIDHARFGEIETRALTKIRRLTGLATHRAWITAPHVTQFDEADVTELEAFRKSEAEAAKERGVKLTLLAFLMKAIVYALKEFPEFNSSLDRKGESLILKKYYNLGVAVDTPEGLVVPVIRDVDHKGLFELAEELGQVSARARARKLSLNDIQGGCFTISSLGGIGGTAFTPILNGAEVAILGVSRMRMSPVWDGERFAPRLMLPLSLSYDHRVIDGAAAARFTTFLGESLSDIRRLLL